jgi:hypothetical protein
MVKKIYYQYYVEFAGDSAYPLMKGLMKPYHDTGNVSPAQAAFNNKLSSTRMIVENGNARLKNKWRRLKLIYSRSMDRAENIIKSCIILHNFVLQHDSELSYCDEPYIVNLPNCLYLSAEGKRDAISRFLS